VGAPLLRFLQGWELLLPIPWGISREWLNSWPADPCFADFAKAWDSTEALPLHRTCQRARLCHSQSESNCRVEAALLTNFARLAAIAVAPASHFSFAVPPVAFSPRVSAAGPADAVAGAPDGSRAVACAAAAGARLAGELPVSRPAGSGLALADYSAARPADGSVPADCLAAPQADGSAGSVPADCSAAPQADGSAGSVPADYSAARLADDSAGSVPADCSAEPQADDSAGSVPADCSVARPADDSAGSVPADCSAAQPADDSAGSVRGDCSVEP
jgi:hypothetical protein